MTDMQEQGSRHPSVEQAVLGTLTEITASAAVVAFGLPCPLTWEASPSERGRAEPPAAGCQQSETGRRER
jgi:hypothetical protein